MSSRCSSGSSAESNMRWVSTIDGQVPAGVDVPGAAEAAIPAERAVVLHCLAKRPRLPGEEVVSEAAARFLLGRQLVGCHGPHRVSRQHRVPVAQEHAGEGQHVVGGRHQSAGSVLEGGRTAVVAIRRVPCLQAVRPGPVRGRQPVGLAGPERRVLHPEGIEDPGSQHLAEGLAGGPAEQHSEHRCAGVVHPPLARLGKQRQRA